MCSTATVDLALLQLDAAHLQTLGITSQTTQNGASKACMATYDSKPVKLCSATNTKGHNWLHHLSVKIGSMWHSQCHPSRPSPRSQTARLHQQRAGAATGQVCAACAGHSRQPCVPFSHAQSKHTHKAAECNRWLPWTACHSCAKGRHSAVVHGTAHDMHTHRWYLAVLPCA